MSKNRRSVIDMGKNLVPARPFLTPASALGVVRERLKRLVGIAPLLRGIDFGYDDAPKKTHVRGDTTTGCTGNPSCCPACGIEAAINDVPHALPHDGSGGGGHRWPCCGRWYGSRHLTSFDRSNHVNAFPGCASLLGMRAQPTESTNAVLTAGPSPAAIRSPEEGPTARARLPRRPPSGKRMLATEET